MSRTSEISGGSDAALPASGETPTLSPARAAVTYVALVILPVLGLLWILRAGSGLPPPLNVAAVAAADSLPSAQIILRTPIFLAQIIVIITAARLVGTLLHKLNQPRVVGEMLAGMMLGPSLLGLAAPSLYASLFPPGTVRFLSALSQIGLVLFMFLVGLDLDIRELINRGRQALVISHATIAIPMLAGGVLALVFYNDFAIAGAQFPAFALFLGCAMSITAFPVLARILQDSGLARSRFGSMAIGCAAVADVTAWMVFALVLSLVRKNSAGITTPMWHTIAAVALYVIIMTTLVRRLLRMICRDERSGANDGRGRLSQDRLGWILLIVLASAMATELLHIHAIFGAFIAGAVMPRDERLNEAIRSRFEDLLSILLLPLFFAYAGLRTNVSSVTTAGWLAFGTIFGFAVLSKLGGCLVAGRATGMSWRMAGSLGVLMNARGLMELVLLTIGLQLGIITPVLFTLMVIMALSTTMMTTPLFKGMIASKGLS